MEINSKQSGKYNTELENKIFDLFKGDHITNSDKVSCIVECKQAGINIKKSTWDVLGLDCVDSKLGVFK
jgi:hypothetical protein